MYIYPLLPSPSPQQSSSSTSPPPTAPKTARAKQQHQQLASVRMPLGSPQAEALAAQGGPETLLDEVGDMMKLQCSSCNGDIQQWRIFL